MSRVIDWLKHLQTQALTIVLTGVLLVVTTVFSQEAIATPLHVTAPVATLLAANPEQLSNPAAEQFEKAVEKTNSALDTFIQEAQLSLSKAIEDTKQAIDELPQQLESAASNTTESARKQFKKDLKAREKFLENTAESVEDLADQVKEFNKKLRRSTKETQGAFQEKAKQSAKNTKRALKNASKAIDTLAEDVENAEEDNSAFFRTQLKEHINALNQAFEEANQSIKALGQEPT